MSEELNKLQELEEEKLKEIVRINELYKKKKDKVKNICPELEDFAFEIITDAKMTFNGMRYAKRKAIFLHHLNKYFIITPKEINKELEEEQEVGTLADNSPQNKIITSDLIGDSNFTRVSEDTKIKDDGVGK